MRYLPTLSILDLVEHVSCKLVDSCNNFAEEPLDCRGLEHGTSYRSRLGNGVRECELGGTNPQGGVAALSVTFCVVAKAQSLVASW